MYGEEARHEDKARGWTRCRYLALKVVWVRAVWGDLPIALLFYRRVVSENSTPPLRSPLSPLCFCSTSKTPTRRSGTSSTSRRATRSLRGMLRSSLHSVSQCRSFAVAFCRQPVFLNFTDCAVLPGSNSAQCFDAPALASAEDLIAYVAALECAAPFCRELPGFVTFNSAASIRPLRIAEPVSKKENPQYYSATESPIDLESSELGDLVVWSLQSPAPLPPVPRSAEEGSWRQVRGRSGSRPGGRCLEASAGAVGW